MKRIKRTENQSHREVMKIILTKIKINLRCVNILAVQFGKMYWIFGQQSQQLACKGETIDAFGMLLQDLVQ